MIGQSVSVRSDATDAMVIASSVGEPERFGEIFDRHYGEIHRYLGRRVGAGLADELAAAAFVVAFRSRGRYDVGAGDARPWLFGIAANLARRHWRTERRRLRAYARTGVDPVFDELADVDRRLDAGAMGPELARALAALRRHEREVLLLYAWADLSYSEISAALGVRDGTVRSRLSRARAHIRELLSPIGQVSGDSATEGATHE